MSDIIAHIPGVGPIKADTRLLLLDACSDGILRRGQNGVAAVLSTGDAELSSSRLPVTAGKDPDL